MGDGVTFDRAALLGAFDAIGRAAIAHGTMLDIAVYGGSALMLASNFRFATEDVDMAELGEPWPEWLRAATAAVARSEGWSPDWLNEAVQFHLSPLASKAADHHEFGSFPRDGELGLRIIVPSLDYMLALKLKAMRINDPAKGAVELADIRNLLRAGGVATIEDALAILGRFFPRSAREPDAQRFFLKHIWPGEEPSDDPPRYPIRLP